MTGPPTTARGLSSSAVRSHATAAPLLSPSLLLLASALLCLALSQPTSAQQLVSVCGGDGYQLNALPELVVTVPINYYTPGSYTLSISLCRPVASGPCAGKNASVCIDSQVLAYWQPDVQPIVWRQENGGVRVSQAYNGDQCGTVFGSDAFALASVDVLCDWTADVPHVGQVQNSGSNCNFNAQLFTRLVCLPPLSRADTPLGLPVSPYADAVSLTGCGAGLYDLSAMDASDLQFDFGGQHYWWRPCGAVAPGTGPCGNGTTLCADSQPNYLSLALGPTWVQRSSAGSATSDGALPLYALTPTGLLIQSKNSVQYYATCANDPLHQAKSQVSVHLVCDSTLSCAAKFLNMSYTTAGGEQTGVVQCHYTLYIATAAVCPSQRLSSAPAPWTLPSVVASPPAGTCASAGFDVSASAVDMYAVDAVTGTYALHPCGNVTNTTYMLTQGGYPAATYIDTNYVQDYLRQPVWSVIDGGVQYVSSMHLQFGGTSATVQFLCVPDAVSPYLGSVVGGFDSQTFTAVVWTQQACGCPAYPQPANYTYSTTWSSAQCGGGVYDLSSLRGLDLYAPINDPAFDPSVQNGGNLTLFVFRACGEPVSYPGCPPNSSLCALSVNVSKPFSMSLAGAQVAVSSPQTQYLVTQQTNYAVDGKAANALQLSNHNSRSPSCAAISDALSPFASATATLQVYLVCDPASVQPLLFYGRETADFPGLYGPLGFNPPVNFTATYTNYDSTLSGRCVYSFTVYTAAACNQTAAPPLSTCAASSSSTGGSGPLFASSSTGASSHSAALLACPYVSSDSLSGGAIAGIVIGSVLGVALLVFISCAAFMPRRGKSAPKQVARPHTPTRVESPDVTVISAGGRPVTEMTSAQQHV